MACACASAGYPQPIRSFSKATHRYAATLSPGLVPSCEKAQKIIFDGLYRDATMILIGLAPQNIGSVTRVTPQASTPGPHLSSSADDGAHWWLHGKLMAASAQKEGPVGSCRRRATEHSRVTPALLARE